MTQTLKLTYFATKVERISVNRYQPATNTWHYDAFSFRTLKLHSWTTVNIRVGGAGHAVMDFGIYAPSSSIELRVLNS